MKRHEALVQLSRDHHFGLLLCWKIKQGLIKNVEINRIASYINLIYNHNLKPHFKEEEDYLFPLLGNEHPLISEAISEHRQIEQMIENGFKNEDNLNDFRTLLEKHIRTEERQMFNEIQEKATEKQLKNLMKIDFLDLKDPEIADEFWK